MPNNGVMNEISSLLAQDKSSTEIIALGFKPSTVYKTQRLMRQQDKNGYSKQSLGGQATSDESHDDAAQTLNQILKPEVEDRREQFIEEQDSRAVAVGAAHFAAEASRLKQENQLLRQKVESLSNYLAQEPCKLVDPVKEVNPSTTPKTIEDAEIPTEPPRELSDYQLTREMSPGNSGDEREGKLTKGVRVFTPRIVAIAIGSFLLVLLGILLVIPITSHDLMLIGYGFLHANNPDGLASYLVWWQRLSMPLGAFLTVSGAVSVYFFVNRGNRPARKGLEG